MKKMFVLLVFAVLLVSMMSSFALAAERPNLKVSLLSYTPVPAQPGSYVTVSLKVLNDGDGAATAAAIEFVDYYPFSVDNTASKYKSIGKLGPQEDYLAEYRVRINSDALQGQNFLKVRYTADINQASWFEREIPITVNSLQKTLAINSVEVTPEMVAPGSKATVNIKLKNLANADLRDVAVKLGLEGNVVGNEYVDIPLAPIGSSVEKRVSLLRNAQTVDFDFELQAYPDAESKIYKIPVALSYTDDENNKYTRTDLISVVINGEPDIMIQIDESSLYSDNGKGKVSFAITNKGFSEIKFLTVALTDTEDIIIRSSDNELYLGNVDSDDYETAEFELSLEKSGLEQLDLPLTLAFKDALNNEYTVEKTLVLPLPSAAEAGQGKSNTGTFVIIGIVLLLVVVWLVRRKRHKAHKKKN